MLNPSSLCFSNIICINSTELMVDCILCSCLDRRFFTDEHEHERQALVRFWIHYLNYFMLKVFLPLSGNNPIKCVLSYFFCKNTSINYFIQKNTEGRNRNHDHLQYLSAFNLALLSRRFSYKNASFWAFISILLSSLLIWSSWSWKLWNFFT